MRRYMLILRCSQSPIADSFRVSRFSHPEKSLLHGNPTFLSLFQPITDRVQCHKESLCNFQASNFRCKFHWTLLQPFYLVSLLKIKGKSLVNVPQRERNVAFLCAGGTVDR